MAAKRKKTLAGNPGFIKRLKAELRAHPQQYDQGQFKPDDGDINVCGTPCCVAGHAYLLAGHTTEQLLAATNIEIIEVANQAMGFDEDATERLFRGGENWPAPFRFGEGTPKKTQVAKACKYLDALLEVEQLKVKHPVLALNL